MKKISNLLMMALLAIGMGLTSCDEQLDNAVVPGVTPGTDEGEVTSITVDLSKIDEKYLDTEKTKLQLTVGDEVTLSFTILPEEMASTEVELTAADATILSIDGLKVKALKEGETKVTAKAGDKTAECTVTVKAAEVAVTSVTLDKTELALTVNDAAQLTATVKPDNASVKSVTWTSDKTSVATVDETGKVTAVAGGTATITAKAGDKTATCTVTVSKQLTYPIALSAVTSDYIGSVIASDGNVYPAKTAVPAGKTAVGILGKVTATGHGLILALKDAAQQSWNTINGWTSVDTYASTTLKQLPDDAARNPLTSYSQLGSTTVSNWCVAQKSDYEAIFTNLGSTVDSWGKTYDGNVNAYITTGVGGTAISGNYWSATDWGLGACYFDSNCWDVSAKANDRSLRPVLGF